MGQKAIAFLMNRIVINEEIYIFKPLNVLEGAYNEEDMEFTDSYGRLYISILESHLGLTESTEFFGFPVAAQELLERYNTKDIEEAKRMYISEIYDNIYMGFVDSDSEEINLIELPVDSLKSLFSEEQVEQSMEMLMQGEAQISYYLEEETIQNMLKMEKIEDLKKVLEHLLSLADPIKEQLLEQVSPEEDKKEEEKITLESDKATLPFDIRDLYNYVSSKVISQDEAIKKIIMNFSLNYLAANSSMQQDFQPTRTLITGSTGVGKTLIIETILEYLEKEAKIKIPMVKVPTSQLTVAGYVGLDLEDVLSELVSKTPNLSVADRVKYAERNGVVFFDEIDKKGSMDNGDVSGRGVLNSLLQFLDGSDYEISVNRIPFYFNTKYLNIFASGAFTPVKEEISRASIGFGTSTVQMASKASVEDYIKKGNMPSEFMGRFHQIVELNPLREQDLANILTNSTASPILIEQAKLMLAGINITWDESFIEEVAKKAYSLKLGARSLKTIIEEALADLKWEALLSLDKPTIEVSRDTVLNPKQYKKI